MAELFYRVTVGADEASARNHPVKMPVERTANASIVERTENIPTAQWPIIFTWLISAQAKKPRVILSM